MSDTRRSRTWYATDLFQGAALVPFEIQRQATLTPEEVGFLVELLGKSIESDGDPEGDAATLRDKLRGKP